MEARKQGASAEQITALKKMRGEQGLGAAIGSSMALTQDLSQQNAKIQQIRNERMANKLTRFDKEEEATWQKAEQLKAQEAPADWRARERAENAVTPPIQKSWWEKVVKPAQMGWNNAVASLQNNILPTLAGMVTPAKSTGGGKVAKLVKDDDPPKESWWDKLKKRFKSKGEQLVNPATKMEIFYSPDSAAMRTYIAAAINIQNEGLNRDKKNKDSHLGPAQLSRDELNTPYGKGFGCANEEKERGCRGFGLGLPDADPFDDNTAVQGMTNRIQQVLEEAERRGKSKGITLDATDRYIIAALSQNGGGFDKDDVQDVISNPKYIKDGEINWDLYFKGRYDGWLSQENTPYLVGLKTWMIIKAGSANKDWNTEFMLELFYEETMKLEDNGYYLPEIDFEEIEQLMNTSESTTVENK